MALGCPGFGRWLAVGAGGCGEDHPLDTGFVLVWVDWLFESDPSCFGMFVDHESSPVYDNVMVEPAEKNHFVQIGLASLAPGGGMVCF